jgi:branched-chain amino acid transport system ATP-binding protein
LNERRRQRAITLSGGEQSMLSIGRALLMNPDLLLLDEPTEGLAPLVVDQVAATIQELKREHQTILLVEQDLSLALELADYVYIMHKGAIVFKGKPEDLRENHDVQSQFLGV